MIEQIQIGSHTIVVKQPEPEGEKGRMLLCFLGENGKEQLCEMISAPGEEEPVWRGPVVGLCAERWNDEYSPWPDSSSAKGLSFAGRGGETLEFLLQDLQPFLGREFGISSGLGTAAALGYSLGGLMALYAFIQSDWFSGAASVSGSLWFPGWCEYLERQSLSGRRGDLYLSLGKAERKIRSARMRTNPDCTRRTEEYFWRQLAPSSRVCLEWNNGGHGFEVTQRLRKACRWLGS